MPCCRSWSQIACVAAGFLWIAAAARGAEPVRLTQDGRQKLSPVFRDAGREIVYAEFRDANLFQLRRLVLADGKNELLHPTSTSAEFEPSFSADGECYAHLKLRGVLSVGITVRDKLGAVLHELHPGNGFVGFRSPALSPDHSRLVFSYADRGTQQIYASKLNGDDRQVLAESRGINNWPSFAPDGKSIVFGSSRDGDFDIYLMNPDGSNLRRLTQSPQQDSRPKFSPDGKRIAFVSHRDGNAEIYIMNADGSDQQRVTDNQERDDFPDWHPDGERLVIVSERAGKHDLYLVDVKD